MQFILTMQTAKTLTFPWYDCINQLLNCQKRFVRHLDLVYILLASLLAALLLQQLILSYFFLNYGMDTVKTQQPFEQNNGYRPQSE